MRKNELQRINSRLVAQRELIANAKRNFTEAYWRNDDDSDLLYKLWQQAINEYNGMAELLNTAFNLQLENMERG